MNICLFTPSFLPDIGGLEMVLDALARQYQAAGHKAVVLSKQSRSGDPLGELPYEVVKYARHSSSTLLPRRVVGALRAAHRRIGFDIVHAHMAYPNGYIAVKLRRKLGVRVVVTSHCGDIAPHSYNRRKRLRWRRVLWTLRGADAVTRVSVEPKRMVDDLTGGAATSLGSRFPARGQRKSNH